MVDTATNPTMLHQPTSFERSQTTTAQFWPTSSSASSSTSFLPPTPTKDAQDASMDSTPSTMEPKKTCDISNLMSPPELAPLDSFKQLDEMAVDQPVAADKRPVPHPPLSPPVSPFSKAANSIGSTLRGSVGVQDPILYPADAAASPPPAPLFTPQQSSDIVKAATERLVNDHIASRPAELFRKAEPPKREDYELALYFKSNCFGIFDQNPRAYLRKERELLRADRANRKPMTMSRPVTKFPTILPAAAAPAGPKPLPSKTMSTRIQKPKSPKVKATQNNPRPIRATPTTIRHTIRVSSTPEPRVRTVAPNREDKDYNSLPDYCPPPSSLPHKANSLKVDWKGNALDLSRDPHAHLLHPDELLLAAGLRLDCATYLTSKRRIFIRRLECARIGKEFRKTDAQQACKIDVNKASKLWTAYEKVGWLDLKWVQRFLAND